MSPISIGVVLPAYNEAESLAVVIPRVAARLASHGLRFELLVVDDGSTDATRNMVGALAHDQRQLRYLRLSRNFGKEAAITAGLACATGDAVIIMDADGQHPVEIIDVFLAQWRAGKKVVYGVQRRRADNWFLSRAKDWFYRVLDSGSAIHIPAHAGDFRLLDRQVVNALNRFPERTRYMKGLYAWVGFEASAVAFDPLPRRKGHSRFSARRLLRLGLTGFTAFSVAPLRLISALGIVVSGAAFVYAAYVVITHLLYGTDVPGWPTLVAGMMLLSGVQLVCLGILGEYLGRVFDEVKQRPLYLIAEDSRKVRQPSGENSESFEHANTWV